MAIKDLKQKYIQMQQEQNQTISPENLRFFYMGKEMKDELFLYSYDIVDEMTIQVMVKKPSPA